MNQSMNHYSYHSEQIVSDFKNGRGQTRRNTVHIHNGKGLKKVETYSPKGVLKNKKEKKLTKSEMATIQKNIFIPTLFQDCITMRPKQKTIRKRNK